MQEVFENNLALFLGAYIVAAVLWVGTKSVEHAVLRACLRYSIIFMVFPLAYFGHPFLYYQVWMLALIALISVDFTAMSILLAVWMVLIAIARSRAKRSTE